MSEKFRRVQDERIVRDKTTGGMKGSKNARFDLIPSGPLWQLAEQYGNGLAKYPPRNWEKGYDWSLSFAAMMRHANQFWSGEDFDPETGALHLTAVAWHAFALIEFFDSHPEKDDRPSTKRLIQEFLDLEIELEQDKE